MGNDIEGKYQKDASIYIFALAEANINRNLKVGIQYRYVSQSDSLKQSL